MPNTCFDPGDLIVPAHDPNAKTILLTVELHPGQVRMLEYILNCDRFPFRQQPQVVRWAVCWALHTLLAALPNSFGLIEAKMNILQDENFERQKDCLGESVQKYIADGNIEGARRLVIQSQEDYQQIYNEYWRAKWLSTLAPAVETQKGAIERGVILRKERP
jgi:hypothetical protein